MALASMLYTIFNLGQVFAEEILGELVQRQTNGYYSLQFNEVHVDILEREIQVQDLYLQADSAKIYAETGLNTVYEIQLSELIINLKSLFKFYIQKKLEIESMRIVNPEIRMQRIAKKASSTSFSFETGNLYKAISDYLTVLKVDYFRIQDGDLNYNSDQFSMGNIDFQIQNLLLDSVVRNDVFYSETIFIEVQNQKFFLPDSIHEIEFDRFVLSTQDSILKFENLSIHPTPDSGAQFDSVNDVNVYDIHIPVLSLKGIDYQSAYRHDHLIINELSFSEPTIFIDDESHGKVTKKGNDNSLLNLLFTVFHKIDVGKLSVIDSELDIKINSDQTYQRIKSEETSVSFYDISLDTSNFRFTERVRYFDNVEISIKNYDYILPDSVHEVKLESLNISSEDSILSIRNLEIAGIENRGSDSYLNLNVPSIDLYGFVYADIIKKELTVKDLLVDRVYVDLHGSNKQTERTKMKLGVSSIYQAIAPIFKKIDIGQFTIGNASLSLPNGITIGSAVLDFEGFKLNPDTKSIEDLFELSYISLRDIAIKRDSIEILGSDARLSHDLTDFELGEWVVQMNQKNLELDAEFQSLKLENLNPDSLLHGNFMTFRKAFIESPKIDIADLPDPDPTKKRNLGIEKEIVISNGSLALNLDSSAVLIDSIDVDFYLGDSIAIHDINAKNISTTFNKLNHSLRLDQLIYDSLNDEMGFIGMQLFPINTLDSSKSLLSISIPKIRINGFIQDQFFDHNELIVNDLFIEQPQGSVYILKNDGKEKANPKLKARIEHIVLSNGEFKILGLGDQIESVSFYDLNSNIDGVNYPESRSLFYSNSLAIEIASIHPELVSDDQLSVGNFSINTSTNSLGIDSISFRKKNGSLELVIANTQFKDLDLNELIDDRQVIATDLTINDPSITLIKSPVTPQKVSENSSLTINLDVLNINDLSVTYRDTINNKIYQISDAQLSLENLDHQGKIDVLEILQNTDEYTLSGDKLNIPVNQFYSITTDDYSYRSDQQKLEISNAHLNPTYSKTEYTKFLEKQKDWFDGSIDYLIISGLNPLEIISDSIVEIGSIKANETNLNIYRDKHLPFPEDQIGMLPAEQIASIPFPTKIDTIYITGDVSYEEQPDDFNQTGIISFDNMDAQIINFTNTDILPSSTMQLNASGQIVEQGTFNVNAIFELARPDQRFSFNGLVENLPLDSLNKMLGPVGSVNIKSGFAEKIEFQFLANDTLAVGDMTFRYKDLKLQVLNRKKHDTDLGSGLMSFFANTFVIRTKNPRFIFPRKGTIYQKRDTSKAIFSYWGKSILSGAVSSVGIHKSDREERKDTKAANKKD